MWFLSLLHHNTFDFVLSTFRILLLWNVYIIHSNYLILFAFSSSLMPIILNKLYREVEKIEYIYKQIKS